MRNTASSLFATNTRDAAAIPDWSRFRALVSLSVAHQPAHSLTRMAASLPGYWSGIRVLAQHLTAMLVSAGYVIRLHVWTFERGSRTPLRINITALHQHPQADHRLRGRLVAFSSQTFSCTVIQNSPGMPFRSWLSASDVACLPVPRLRRPRLP